MMFMFLFNILVKFIGNCFFSESVVCFKCNDKVFIVEKSNVSKF